MKILFLTAFTPHLRAGGEKFTYLLLDDFAKENQVDLVYWGYKDDEKYIPISSNIRIRKVVRNTKLLKVWNCLKLPFLHPIFTIRFSFRLLLFIKSLIAKEQYDLIYIDHSQMFLYGKFLKTHKKIMMSHDVMGQRFERQGNVLLRSLALKSEGWLLKQSNSVVFSFSDKDRNIIKQLYNVESEVTHFYLDEPVIKARPVKIENRILFFGKWNRADNYEGLIWFMENITPLLDKTIRIDIIGGWLANDFINKYIDNNRITYHGIIDNPYEFITNSIAVISPLFSGAGVKVKVVESLACGVPVIGTGIAFEGITYNSPTFMIRCTSPEDYISCINITKKIDVTERQGFKKSFLTDYENKSIVSYLKTRINKTSVSF